MTSDAAPLLTAEAVAVRFGDRQVLRGVDLTIRAAEAVALIGRDGSGRSTLLRALNRTEPVDDGEVRFAGRRLPTGGRELATLRADVALVLPAFNLPPQVTVRAATVAAARRVRGWARDRAETATDAALARVSASAEADTPAGELTGAASLRAAVGRALALDARILLLDDPTVALGATDAGSLRSLLSDLVGEVTLVLATSDEALVRTVATRAVRLEAGRVVADGPVDEVLAHV